MANADRLIAIFNEAKARPAGAERERFLADACTGDPELKEHVLSLLQAHEGAGDFLMHTLVVSPTERPGDAIGRYKLREMLGEGGCGVVYVAEQEEPVRRRVALKVIKLGMDTNSVIARFGAERQALAMMDHPNIAKVLDAGTTDTGRPYFVMELVRGVRITDYCDQANLSTKDRLDLFIKVCQAIQHAHQKGIIHRDIKPSNILVTLHDGVPVPKVIDFGIAKATEGRLTDNTVYTQLHQFIGTPAYMSPEQAEMSGLDIDTRSDIYSLGVLLYELLAGSTPFDATELMASGIDAMRKTIREKEPVRPSTKLSQTLVAAEVRRLKTPASETPSSEEEVRASSRRRLRVKETITLLKGDLDWIVMKCLEKDRTRRYDTANGLAMDIQRHLTNEPIVARPPSTAYKIQKACQRNKLVYTAGAAMALVLVVGTGVSIWQAMRATQARQEETRQRLAADAAREHALTAQKTAEEARTGEAEMRHVAEGRAYAGDMNLAQQALVADNLGLATELLDRHRPRPGQLDRRGWEWRYLWQHTRSDALYTLCQQSNRISGLTVSHDGKWLAIDAGGVSVWNLASRQGVLRQKGTALPAFSPVRSWLAMLDADGFESPEPKYRLRVWDAETGGFVSNPPSPDVSAVTSMQGLVFAADGQSAVTASSAQGAAAKELTLWRLADGKKLATYPVNIRGLGVGLPVSIAQGTNLVAVAEDDRQVRVIDVDNGNEKLRLVAPGKGWLEAVALSADGRTLAACSGTDETVVRLWDVSSGRELGILDGHRAYVIALLFWPDGKTLASAAADQTIRIWDVAEKRALAVLRGQKDEIHRLALLPDNSTLISGAKDGTVMVWDTAVVRRRKPIVTLPRPVQGFWAPAIRGDSVLTLANDGWLIRWGGRDFQEAESLVQVQPDPQGVCLSSDQRLLAVGTDTGVVKLWDVSQRRLYREIEIATGKVLPRMFLSGDTRLAVWNAGNRTLAIHDVTTGRLISFWSAPGNESGPDAFSPDGRWCLTSGPDRQMLLRDLSSGRELGALRTTSGLGRAFSPDGKQLAIAYDSGLVRLWDVRSLTERAPFRGFLRAAHSVAFSPDGRRLAVGSGADETIKLWDLESGQPMLTLPGEGGPCWDTAFSADGNIIATQHQLGILDVWRVPSWSGIADAEANQKAAFKGELRP